MRFLLSAVSCALLLSSLVQAKNSPSLPEINQIVQTTTTASASPAFVQLQMDVTQRLLAALKGDATTLTSEQAEEAKQNKTQADKDWLKASQFDFAKATQQKAGIALLSTFPLLPKNVIGQNMATVENINHSASDATRHQALVDAYGQSYLYFLADALGPRLGKAFLAAYDKGEINKAAALIKQSEVSTGEAKKQFNNPRPFKVAGNTIRLVNDDAVVMDNQPYAATGGSFPSGHTSTSYTDALLLGEMLPERFIPLVNRAAKYGYSRLVMGGHYPLDLIGSRMVAQRNVATYLNDPAYRKLFDEAKQQLRSALEKECGTSLAVCAKSSGNADDPYNAPEMKTFYRFTMTYGLPAQKAESSPVVVPEGAEVLLEGPLPNLSAGQRRQLMVKTALANGYPLSGDPAQSFWQRLNLHDAAEQGLSGAQ